LVVFLKVLILTGMPGSGKSSAVELAKQKGIPVFRMGDAVWAEVRFRGLALENEVVGKIASEMRQTHGPGIWAMRTVELVRKAKPAKLIIIDGCRSHAEIDIFQKEFGPDLQVVAIIATQKTRFKRLKARSRQDDIKTLSDLKARDQREVKWGLDKVIKTAQIKVRNEGTEIDLKKSLGHLIERMLNE
jgi:dephospho-CoA kinase